MKTNKTKKIETYKDKYFTTIVYEYRGCNYEVTYANGWQVCCTPAWVQHRDEQAKIDKMLDNPTLIEGSQTQSFEEQLDEVWKMLGWQ